MTRYRGYSTSESGGWLRTSGSDPNQQNTTVSNNTNDCWDENEPKGTDNHVLNVLKYRWNGGRYDRIYTGSGPSASNYLCDYYRNFNNIRGRHAPTTCPSIAVLSSKAIMASSPNTPMVDVPTAIYELRELPMLLRKVPRNIKAVADINLKYQFGIKPMVRDVISLLGIAKELRHRIRNLEHLYKTGTGRKTVNLGDYSGEYIQSNTVLQSVGGYIVRDLKFRTRVKVKGHVRYHVESSFTAQPESKAVRSIIDTTLGNTIDLVTLWNAIPFGWLADWVSNSEEIIARHRNIVPTIIDSVRIMKSHQTTVDAEGYNWGYASLSPYQGFCEAKWREIGDIQPSFSLDDTWFKPRQLGILGSIAAIRWRRT